MDWRNSPIHVFDLEGVLGVDGIGRRSDGLTIQSFFNGSDYAAIKNRPSKKARLGVGAEGEVRARPMVSRAQMTSGPGQPSAWQPGLDLTPGVFPRNSEYRLSGALNASWVRLPHLGANGEAGVIFIKDSDLVPTAHARY